MQKTYNLNAGPAALPKPVLEKAQKDFLNFNNSGISILEHSHRGKDYDAVHYKAMADLRILMDIPDNYEILFLQGGASLQFSMVPLNFLDKETCADYLMTGGWSEKACEEADKIGSTHIAATSKETRFDRIPREFQFNTLAEYVHVTSNNTLFGTQWQNFPDTGTVPLVADMSSDILSRKTDITKFALIYAGAQKNLGPAGLTVVIIRKDMLDKARKNIPTMLAYQTFVKSASLYNTPPVFSIYIFGLVLEWLLQTGGLEAMEKLNNEKANLLYNTMDQTNGFYKGTAQADSRSKMNVTFRLVDPELEKLFLEKSIASGFVGLKGHRSVGGLRASIYNAVPLETVQALTEFMTKFYKQHG